MPAPVGLSETLGSLSRTLLTDDANLQAGLRRVAAAGCSLLVNCSSASVTIIEHGRPSTMAATSDVAKTLDETQYRFDDGPCLTAARQSPYDPHRQHVHRRAVAGVQPGGAPARHRQQPVGPDGPGRCRVRRGPQHLRRY